MRKYLYVLAVVLMATGLLSGDAQLVWQKAVRICLECIGLG